MVVVGMELCNVGNTSHAASTLRSAFEIVGIAKWFGLSCHVSMMQHCWVVGI
jgi:hypothetical protein